MCIWLHSTSPIVQVIKMTEFNESSKMISLVYIDLWASCLQNLGSLKIVRIVLEIVDVYCRSFEMSVVIAIHVYAANLG